MTTIEEQVLMSPQDGNSPSQRPTTTPFGIDPARLTAPLRHIASAELSGEAAVWFLLPQLGEGALTARDDLPAEPPADGMRLPLPAPGGFGQLGWLVVGPDSDLPATALSRVAAQAADFLAPTLTLLRMERDGLTGLPTRRYLEGLLAAGCTRPLGLLLIDLDGLAEINRAQGYQSGDRLIAALGVHLAERMPRDAVLCRHGGDEFALLVPEAAPETVSDLARELQRFSTTPPARRAGATLSVGYACAPGAEAGQLIGRAEAALATTRGQRSALQRWHPDTEPPRDRPDPLSGLLSADWGRSQRNLSLLLEVLEASNAQTDAETIMARVVDWTIALSGTERGLLFLDGEQGPVQRVARQDQRPLTGEASYATSIVERVLRTGRPTTMSAEMPLGWEHGPSVYELGLHTALCVPVRARGADRCLGALYVDGMRDASFTDEDVRFFEALARQLCPVIERARLQSEVERLNETLRQRLELTTTELREARRELSGQYQAGAIVSRSPAMRRVMRLLDKVVDSHVPVLIQGESGTGKELAARSIHHNGPRGDRPFVAENCGALSETLLESELFGHRKGAFTGATEDHEGLLARADGGTLFLDEIGEMSLDVQKKLLRFLQEGEYRPLGHTENLTADVRVISATHRDLAAEVEAGTFRADLYYRINVVQIGLPPLRGRLEDLPLLVDHLLAKHAPAMGKDIPSVAPEVLERLMRYPWPGNIRELENEIQRALVFCGDHLALQDLPAHLLHDDIAYLPASGMDLKQATRNLERKLLVQAMEEARGNRAEAARILGVPRSTLLDKLAKHELDL